MLISPTSKNPTCEQDPKEQWKKSWWLRVFWGIIVPSPVGIMINHYQDPKAKSVGVWKMRPMFRDATMVMPNLTPPGCWPCENWKKTSDAKKAESRQTPNKKGHTYMHTYIPAFIHMYICTHIFRFIGIFWGYTSISFFVLVFAFLIAKKEIYPPQPWRVFTLVVPGPTLPECPSDPVKECPLVRMPRWKCGVTMFFSSKPTNMTR